MSIVKTLQQAIEQQNIEKVYEIYHQFFESFSAETSFEELIDLAEYSVSIGFYEEAKRAFILLAEQEPDESSWSIQLAELFVNEGEYDQALSILYDIPENDANYPAVLMLQAELYQQQGYSDVAEKKLLKAKEIEPEEPIIDYYLGTILFENGKLERAIYFLEQYCQKDVQGMYIQQATLLLIETYLLNAQPEEALEKFPTLELESIDNALLIAIAREYTYHQQESRAIELYSEVLLRDTDALDAYYGLAELSHAKKEYELSNEQLSAIIERNPYYSAAYLLKMENERALGQIEHAIKTAEQLVEIRSDSSEAVIHLAELLYQNEEYERVVEVIEQALTQDIFDPAFHFMLAQAHDALENYEIANEQYELAEPFYRDSIEFILSYAIFLREDGRISQALQQITHGLEIEPLQPDLIELLSQMQER